MGRKTFRKVITSQELTEKISVNNKKLISRFIKEKNTRCSIKTITNYKSDTNIFFTWNLLYNNNKFFADIKKIELAEFFSFAVEELKWGSSRFARMRSCVSGLCEFIIKFYDDEYPNYRNIVLQAIDLMPKSAVREKTILSEEQVNGLFDYLKNDLNNSQEACLLATYVCSGVRFSEALEFTVDIIDPKNLVFENVFMETLKPIKTKGFTKNGKMLTKYFIKDLFLKYYNDWLIEREKILKENNIEHNFLFIKRNGEPATEATLRRWFIKWDKFLEESFYPHCLRHYIVTYLTKIGLTSDFIIEIMGWGSGDMYNIYNDLSAKDRKWKNLDKLKEALK